MSYFKDADGELREGRIISNIVAAVVVLVIVLFFLPFTQVSAGHRGVVTVFGAVSDRVLEPGLHLINPLANVHKISVQTETISFDNKSGKGDTSESSSLFAATKDLQDVQIATVVTYHIPETLVKNIYQQYQGAENFQTNKLSPIVRESVKATSALYTAEELVTKRSEYSDKVTALINTKFAELGATFESFKVVNFEFSAQFSHAIEAKATAVQNAEAEKNKLVSVQFQAQQQIESAKAQAETIRIQAQAIQQQGGAEYVNLKAVEKWNGQLPTQMIPGSAVPFININR